MNNIKKHIKKLMVALFFVLPFLSFPSLINAGEIQYGGLKEVKGDTLFITYKGPSGEQNFTCDIETLGCLSNGTTTPEFFPP
ncbi:hypothetical protein KKG48_00530, partial [Patescibacteria group bacterium]|nr:hypothetical protein [Patescibacteria group bacterium]